MSFVNLASHMVAHAKAAFDTIGVDPVIADAIYALRWIQTHAIRLGGAFTFSVRDLGRTWRFRSAQDDRLAKALHELHGRNIVSPDQKRQTGGRPELFRYANPCLLQALS